MRAKYRPVTSGELLQIPRHWIIGCCDCHLVHDLHFYIRKRKIFVRVYRNERRTAARRREDKK